jgi:hypothetical protein
VLFKSLPIIFPAHPTDPKKSIGSSTRVNIEITTVKTFFFSNLRFLEIFLSTPSSFHIANAQNKKGNHQKESISYFAVRKQIRLRNKEGRPIFFRCFQI